MSNSNWCAKNDPEINPFDIFFSTPPACHVHTFSCPQRPIASPKPINIKRPAEPKSFTFGGIYNTFAPNKPPSRVYFEKRTKPHFSNDTFREPVHKIPKQPRVTTFCSRVTEEYIFDMDDV